MTMMISKRLNPCSQELELISLPWRQLTPISWGGSQENRQVEREVKKDCPVMMGFTCVLEYDAPPVRQRAHPKLFGWQKDKWRQEPVPVQLLLSRKLYVLLAPWLHILSSPGKYTHYLRHLPVPGHVHTQDRIDLVEHTETGLSERFVSTDVLINMCCNWQSCFICLHYH